MFSGVVSCIRLQQPAVITGDYVVIAAGRETYQLIRMEMWREKSNGGPSLYISVFLVHCVGKAMKARIYGRISGNEGDI